MMYGKILRASALAVAVAAFTAPGFAQTNTNSGTMQKDETDVSKQNSGQPMTKGASPQAPRATTGGSAGTQNPGTIDSGGAHIQGNQQGGNPGTVGATPGGPTGAPANPCTPELKAQNRC
jgi:hypothetical protein